MPWGFVAAAIGIGSAVGSYQAGKRQSAAMDAQADAMRYSADKQYDIQNRLTSMGEEEWKLYKEKALPLIDKMIADSSTPDRSAEEMALAADETKTAYAAGRQALLRRVNLSEDAGGPRSGALLAPSYMDEASAVGRAVTEARRRERARVEDTNWGRKIQTVGVLQRLPQDASANLQGASAAAARAGELTTRGYGDQARQWGEQAGQLAYGAGYLARNAQRWMSRGGGGSGGGGSRQDVFGDDYGADYGSNYYDSYAEDMGDFSMRDGGRVTRRGAIAPRSNYRDGGKVDTAPRLPDRGARLRDYDERQERIVVDPTRERRDRTRGAITPEGTERIVIEGQREDSPWRRLPGRVGDRMADGGAIRGPGTGTSDSIETTAEENSYILSADTVRAVGESKINKWMEQAGIRPGFGGGDKGGVPVRLSNGEYQIPRRAVAFHGEEFFNKLQQKYHRPTQQDDGMANGGVIRKKLLPSVVEDAIYNAMPHRALTSRRRG